MPTPNPGAREAGGGHGLFADDFEPEPVQYSLAVDDLRLGSRRYHAVRIEGRRSARLWKSKIEATGFTPADWEESLRAYVKAELAARGGSVEGR